MIDETHAGSAHADLPSVEARTNLSTARHYSRSLASRQRGCRTADSCYEPLFVGQLGHVAGEKLRTGHGFQRTTGNAGGFRAPRSLFDLRVWFDRPRWGKERLRRLVALKEDDECDLVELWTFRFVLPRATGQSITVVNAEVQNLIAKPLRVLIRPGNMLPLVRYPPEHGVTSIEYRFRLAEHGTERTYVRAACINAELSIPGPQDRFHGVERVSEEVMRFLEMARDEDPMVIPAGVLYFEYPSVSAHRQQDWLLDPHTERRDQTVSH